MQVIREGFVYVLDNFEDKHSLGQIVNFVQRERSGDSTHLIQEGTTIEELLYVAIHRLTYLNEKHTSVENFSALQKLKEAVFWLNDRQRQKTIKFKNKSDKTL